MKFRRALCLCLLLAASASPAWSRSGTPRHFDRVYEAVVRLHSLDDLRTLRSLDLAVDGRDGMDLRITASAAEIGALRAGGWAVTVRGRNVPPRAAAAYYTYDTCTQTLQQWAAAYPDITELTAVATTAQSRTVWLLRITGDLAAGAPKPRLMFDATIHGDEWIAMEVAMGFVNELLTNYGSDTTVTALVDDLDIFVIPMDNPDGIAADTRENGNGVDLNRDFPYWWNTGGDWAGQPETVGLMKLALANNYVMGVDYHSGWEVINYLWDGVSTLTPDNDIEVAAANTYQAKSGYNITNGAAWYIANGTEEDFWHGNNGTTSAIVEISYNKIPPAGQIATYVNKNVPSMMDWAALARTGIWGTATDADTGDPVEAVIFAGGHLPAHANLDHGDFYRILLPGTYDLKVWANGYGWSTVSGVVVPETGHVAVPIQLHADHSGQIAAVRSLFNVRLDWNDNPPAAGLPIAALGGPDGAGFTPGAGGYGVFDMGANSLVPTADGWSLQVTALGAAAYNVRVASDWDGPWTSLGAATGTKTFSLSGIGASTIRYVEIADTSTIGAPAGTAIDSIVAFQSVDDDDNDDNDSSDDDDDAVDDDNDDNDTTDDDASPDDDDDSADDDASPVGPHHNSSSSGNGCGC